MSQKSKNPLTAMAAGCIAGGVEASAVWPMEFIKVSVCVNNRIFLPSMLPILFSCGLVILVDETLFAK
jgi:hypothetical protein